MILGDMLPQRQSSTCMFDLLQNCDLPPPLKVFPAPEKDEKRINSVLPTLQSPPLPPPLLSGFRKLDQLAGELVPDQGENTSDLLKALRLSQTRAREAERKASAVGERNERIITVLLEDSLRLFAHRQWVKLLEIEISWLREEKRRRDDYSRRLHEDGSGVPSTSWGMSFTLCLGIAGVGIALGCRYLL